MKFFLSLMFCIGFSSYAEESSEQSEYPASAIWRIEVPESTGTGFFISPNLFVTNFHVIKNGLQLDQIILSRETLFPGSSFSRTFTRHFIHIKSIRKSSAMKDLLLLETKESIKEYLPIAGKDSEHSKNLFVIGYPDGQWAKIKQTGEVRSYGHGLLEKITEKILSYGLWKKITQKRRYSKDHLFLFSVDYHNPFDYYNRLKGVSGSPVLNQKNEVVGVVSRGSINIIHAIQTKKLYKFITKDNRSIQTDVSSVIKKEMTKLKKEAQKGSSVASLLLNDICRILFRKK